MSGLVITAGSPQDWEVAVVSAVLLAALRQRTAPAAPRTGDGRASWVRELGFRTPRSWESGEPEGLKDLSSRH